MKVDIKTIIILGLLFFLILLLMAVLCQKPSMERRLAQSVHHELLSAGFDVDTVLCTNRDVVIYGSVEDTNQWYLTSKTASLIPGVLTINNEFTIKTGKLLQIGLDSLLSHYRITFENNSQQLAVQADITLDRIDSLLTQYPDQSVNIIGHTDSEGDSLYNLKLSLERAASVRDELISRGFSEDRFLIFGMGENQPITTNSNEEGRKKNRRVEFVVTNK